MEDDDDITEVKVQWAAYMAMILSIISFVPSFVTLYHKKDSSAINHYSVMMRIIASVCWVIYAYVNMFPPNMVSSVSILIMMLVYAGFVFYYRRFPGGLSNYEMVRKSS